ncbi:response regulator [Desulfoluna spongiiphila]|uniref:histidine kinase n=1 Tax=Desulfoluna spongiiphila TaxID=419481 RepID=A0A1G5HIP7_9BACT|nr:response regulator [Desulfoluna spongiiphila]SCY63597.1 PAS domain S-box-containing protein [Desulfoluna spongiiphila]
MKLWRYIFYWALLVAALSVILWFGVYFLKGEMRHKERLAKLRGYRTELGEMIGHRWKVLESLSTEPMVLGALSGAHSEEVERLFDMLANAEHVAIVYLLNNEGLTVASSEYDDGKRLTGVNYRFRPYFKYAMTGRRMVLPAVGVTTFRRGIYMSIPVWGRGMDPVGVLVFKLSMDPVDALFQRASNPVVLMDSFGVVFAGNTPEWFYHVAGDLSDVETAGVDLKRQFGGRPLKPLGWDAGAREVSVEGSLHEVVSEKMPSVRWTVVGLFSGDLYPALPPGQLMITRVGYLAGLLLITMVISLWATVSRRQQAELILIKHRETLEGVVNRRTLQLEVVNDTLVRELEEKRFAEKRLRENETSFKRANRIAGLGSWEWYLAEDRLLLSDVMMAIYDDGEGESVEGRFEEVIHRMVHPEDTDMVVRAGREMAATGKGEPLEYRIVRGNGDIRWIRAEVPEVKEFRRSGEVISLIGTVQDITDRKLNENSLLRFKAAMEQSVDGIAVADLAGVVEFVNPSWAKMHGYRAEELVGVNLSSFHTRDQVEGPLRDFLRKVTRYGSCEGEIDHVARNGREFPTWMSSSLMADHEGNPIGIVWICREISTQKHAEAILKRAKEEAEAATRAKSAFLANMSHEIRTPMNGVIGMIDILLDTGLTAEQKEYAESVKSSADALLILINDILDFSKIEAGKLDIEAIDFNLRNVVEPLSDVMAIKAAEKHIAFGCLIQDNVPVHLNGDPVRLRQILTNLAGNAVKFVEAGSVMIRVALKEAMDSRVRLFFEVVDTGIGIQEEARARIFDSFSQGDVSTTRRYGGTGLGLSISQQLTRLMNGNIGVESQPGQGTIFWFTAEFDTQPEAREEWVHKSDALENVHLLIVDDNSVNRWVFREYARSWGCRVAEAESGEAAMQMAEEALKDGEPFDVAIIDMQMPGMDGESLGRCFKERETTKDIPLLMATSIGQKGDAEHMKEVGFAACLTKPVRKNDLSERLIQVLDRGASGAVIPGPAEVERKGRGDSMAPVPALPAMHVLLAEDNLMNQRVAVSMLQKLGHTVKVVSNGLEAVDAFGSEAFDLVLMDGQMPVMDGLEATLAIRRMEQDAQESPEEKGGAVPIVAVTANAMTGDRERFLGAGMDEYITKPIKKKELEEVIGRVMGQRA